MASTYAGVTFQTVRDGDTLSLDMASADIAETHIPGSNRNVLDIGGLRPSRITRRIKIAPADTAALMAARLSVARLTLIDVAYGDALLEQLTEHEQEIDGSCEYFTAQWALVG